MLFILNSPCMIFGMSPSRSYQLSDNARGGVWLLALRSRQPSHMGKGRCLSKHSGQACGDPAEFGWCVFAGQWRSRYQIFALGQASNEHGLETGFLYQIRREGNCLWVVAGNRDANRLSRSMAVRCQTAGANRIESPDDMRAWEQLRCRQARAALVGDKFRDGVSVTA